MYLIIVADNADYRNKKKVRSFLKTFFQISLVSEDGVKNIEFRGTLYQAVKVFYALSFALCESEYTELYLFAGESQLNKTTFTKVR